MCGKVVSDTTNIRGTWANVIHAGGGGCSGGTRLDNVWIVVARASTTWQTNWKNEESTNYLPNFFPVFVLSVIDKSFLDVKSWHNFRYTLIRPGGLYSNMVGLIQTWWDRFQHIERFSNVVGQQSLKLLGRFQHRETYFNVVECIPTFWNRFQNSGAYFNILKRIAPRWDGFQRGGNNIVERIPTWWERFKHGVTNTNIVGQFEHVGTYSNVVGQVQHSGTFFNILDHIPT